MNDHMFEIAGIRLEAEHDIEKKKWYRDKPVISMLLLAAILLGCAFAEAVMTKDPTYMDLSSCNLAPCGQFLFGTDTLGRDIFSMIWYGGRISIFIGFLATFISTFVAVTFGAFSGISSEWVDSLMMRATEILLSIPSLLIMVLIQAILGKATIISISIVIGLTSWMSIAKIVRTEVRQIRNSEYVIASKAMGGSFFHVLWKHLAPNFFSSIVFMIVMNIRSAIVAESTLSFLGIGLPIDVISWGSMLSLAEKGMLTGNWWIVIFPGFFLVLTLVCITNIGDWLRAGSNKTSSKL